MGQTFLAHAKGGCGGNVVIDASQSAKLIAPSFSINSGGITGLTLDIDISNSGKLVPAFLCMKCSSIVDKGDLGKDLIAVCQVCAKEKLVVDLHVHPQITCLCESCLEELKMVSLGGKAKNPRVLDYVSLYNLKPDIKTVPLAKVLASPIKL